MKTKTAKPNPTPAARQLAKHLLDNQEHHFEVELEAQLGYNFFDIYIKEIDGLHVNIFVELDGLIHTRPDVAQKDKLKEVNALLSGFEVIRINSHSPYNPNTQPLQFSNWCKQKCLEWTNYILLQIG